MSDLLYNPWFWIIVVISVIVGNISVLKYTANMKFPTKTNHDNKNQNNDDNQDGKS